MSVVSLPRASRAEAEAGRFFDARPATVQTLLASRDLTILASGPAGTGKTRAWLEKIRACSLKYPRIRCLILRSVRKWLTQSALVTWEDKTIVPGELIPDRVRRESRSEYRFRNGSVVVVAGLDDPQQVMSAEYDLALIVEATEVSQATVETVRQRLRNQKMPYQQLMLDCNPGPSTHWLKKDTDPVELGGHGRFRRVDTTHRDNPLYFDQATQNWTPPGRAYMAVLDTLTGTRRLRLRDGIWASAEGIVYDSWSSAVHVIDSFRVPDSWDRYWTADFGFTNPFGWQEWAIDPDGRAYMVREIYHTKILVEDHAKRIKELTKTSPRPRRFICDHDAEGRATLEKYIGVTTTAANKAVDAGIQGVDARLRPAGDGKPRLFLFRDALDRRDEELVAAGKPCCTAEEFDGYVWDTSAGQRKGERPLKQNDHGMDQVRYLIADLDSGGQGRWSDASFAEPGYGSVIDEIPGGVFGAV